jgi:hypothetical protein
MKPQIISSYDGGKLGVDLDAAVSRIEKSAQWKDLSTVVVIPSLNMVPTKAVAAWLNMYNPPNQRVARMFAVGMEVGEAYSRTIESIVEHQELSKWRFILTLESDNIPPSDGFVNLLATMDAHPEFSAIGGLYFTKGEGGVPQIWGDPKSFPLNFRPQMPDRSGGLKECCGTGMGFTIFRMSMFKDGKIEKPWFRTTANSKEGMYSQDLYFWERARKAGHRCAIDCSVKVGHYDVSTDIVW